MIQSILLIAFFTGGASAITWMNFTNYLSVECSYYANYTLRAQLWEHDVRSPHDKISEWQEFCIQEKCGIADITVTGTDYEDETPIDQEIMFQIEHDCTFSRKMEMFVVHFDEPVVVPFDAAGNVRREPSWLLTDDYVRQKPGFAVIGKRGIVPV